MYKRICLLSVLLFGGAVFSYDDIPAIRKYPTVQNKPSIQASSIVRTNVKNTGANPEYLPAIEELKSKIKQNPNNNEYYALLADVYIKSGQYEKAYDELIYLTNLSRQNKLDTNVLSAVNSMYQTYRQNVRYDRNRVPLCINLALMSLILNENARAEEYISMSADSISEQKMLKSAIPIVFDITRNPQKAIYVCDKYISKNPQDVEMHKLKASYLVQTGNKDGAIEEYSKILSAKPTDNDAKYYLYKALSAKNASEKEIIRQIYKTDKPNYEKVYYELADMLLRNDEVQPAQKYAEMLVNKFPDNADGYILLSEIYKKEGKLKESLEALEKVRDKADNNEAIAKYNVMLAKMSDRPVEEANSLMANGLYQQALEVLESANQDALYVILTEARANYLLNKKGNTFDLLNKAMSLYPENSDVYCAFGYIYLQEKDIETARNYVNRSLKINPENRTTLDLQDMVNKAETDKMMSNIVSTYESQNYAEAMRLIDEAIAINKKDSNLYLYKALTYIAQNNYAASTASLYKSIELDKNNKLAYFYLATAFENLSEPENALQNYQKFVELLRADDFGESEKREYAFARINKLQKSLQKPVQ